MEWRSENESVLYTKTEKLWRSNNDVSKNVFFRMLFSFVFRENGVISQKYSKNFPVIFSKYSQNYVKFCLKFVQKCLKIGL